MFFNIFYILFCHYIGKTLPGILDAPLTCVCDETFINFIIWTQKYCRSKSVLLKENKDILNPFQINLRLPKRTSFLKVGKSSWHQTGFCSAMFPFFWRSAFFISRAVNKFLLVVGVPTCSVFSVKFIIFHCMSCYQILLIYWNLSKFKNQIIFYIHVHNAFYVIVYSVLFSILAQIMYIVYCYIYNNSLHICGLFLYIIFLFYFLCVLVRRLAEKQHLI